MVVAMLAGMILVVITMLSKIVRDERDIWNNLSF